MYLWDPTRCVLRLQAAEASVKDGLAGRAMVQEGQEAAFKRREAKDIRM